MTRIFSTLAIITVMVFAFTVAAYAEMVQGTIVEISPNDNQLTINRMDAASGRAEQLQIAIDPQTQFQGGVSDLQSLKVGDEIQVDADQNFVTRQWKANSIQKGSAGPAATSGPLGQQQQSSGMEQTAGSNLGQSSAAGSQTGVSGPGGAGTKSRTPGSEY